MAISHRTPLAGLLMLLAMPALAGEIAIGPTYPVAEPDAAAELRRRAATVDWSAWMRRDPQRLAAFDFPALPRAAVTRTRLFDPTYTLPRDLLDARGHVLFAAGYRFNLYEHVPVRRRYIVIGPAESDYRWLQRFAQPGDTDKVLVAGGNILEMRARHARPLFLLEPRFIERFGVQAVPCIIQPRGNRLEVREYAVPEHP